MRGISFSPAAIPVMSNVSGEPFAAGDFSPEYWVRHAREPVRFAAGMQWLGVQGVTSFLELGPSAVLSAVAEECNGDGVDPVVAVALLRDARPEPESLLRALAESWAHGTDVDWAALYAGLRAERVTPPTYAFQRERYWLLPGPAAGDADSIGLSSADHPLLGAMIELAEGERWLFTACVSPQNHSWLADHAVEATSCCQAPRFSIWLSTLVSGLGVPPCGSSRCRRHWCSENRALFGCSLRSASPTS